MDEVELQRVLAKNDDELRLKTIESSEADWAYATDVDNEALLNVSCAHKLHRIRRFLQKSPPNCPTCP